MENPEFATTTYLIDSYLNDELARGFAAQNQLYASVAGLLRNNPDAARQAKQMQTPIYQADTAVIQCSFMSVVQAVKAEHGNDLAATRELTTQAVKKIYTTLTKGQNKPLRHITAEQVADAVAQSVSHLPGVNTDAVKQLFLAMTAR